MIIREPAVAGMFYDLNPQDLKKQINACFKHKFGPKTVDKKPVKAGIVPHAGYQYSGHVAAWVYSRLEKANYIILGPNHHGIGSTFAVMKEGLWKTPLGEVAIDRKVAEKILDGCSLVEYDVIPHRDEHSIEVQLPFLQHMFGSEFKFVPISIKNEFADDDFLKRCELVGNAIADAVKNEKEKWVVIASSDFSHYIPHELAKDIDNYVIGSILKLDGREFFSRINEKNASVCGFGPIAIALAAAKNMGAKKTELLKYATSGDVTQEFGSVVGYASIAIL